MAFTGETKVGDPQNWCADISPPEKNRLSEAEDEAGVFDYVNWVKAEG